MFGYLVLNTHLLLVCIALYLRSSVPSVACRLLSYLIILQLLSYQ